MSPYRRRYHGDLDGLRFAPGCFRARADEHEAVARAFRHQGGFSRHGGSVFEEATFSSARGSPNRSSEIAQRERNVPPAWRHVIAKLSQRQSFAKGEATGEARGRAAEKAADVLDARGLDITDAQRQRVLGCSDLQTLARWLRRAVTVSSTDALFEE